MTLAEDFDLYQQNILPSMLEVLAEDLSVSTASLQTLGVGFYPAKQAWVFAERDHKGEIIGLSLRSVVDGKKWMVEGSKRGLFYPYNENHLEGDRRYEPGRCHWVRIAEAGIDCPICAKPDWCLISSDDPDDPSAVLCSRISEGSVREIPGVGYLHLRRGLPVSSGNGRSTLLQTELPIIVVEGASDILAAMDLGFVAIGKPSASGGMAELKKMPLAGKEVWIIGENDAGAGKEGMDKTYVNLKDTTERVMCIMPPAGVKDLRQWVGNGLTQEALFTYVGQHGVSEGFDPDIFTDDIARTIALKFLEEHKDGSIQTLRRHHNDWYKWRDGRYTEVQPNDLRGMLYCYLDGKKCIVETSRDTRIAPYKPTRSKVSDVIDALNGEPAVYGAPPVWIEQRDRPDTRDLIAFNNGLLDVNAFCRGEVRLLNPTPELFTLATIPYDYDEGSWSRMMVDYCNETFNNDPESVRLLAQWLGYNLVHDLSHEKCMFYIGPTRSGKSTLLAAMEAMLGKEQCGSTNYSTLANTHGLSPLVGKSTVIAGDAKAARKYELDAVLETILRITGQDSVPINQKYAKMYHTNLTCRFTMAMNELPAFSDNSKAIAARALFLSFPNTYLGREDFTIKSRLIKEAENGKLVNFALWGLKDLRESGKFTEPAISKRMHNQLIALTSPITMFVEECCLVSDDVEIDKMTMYDAWKAWCSDTGQKPSNNVHFGRWLFQEIPSIKVTQKRDGDGRNRVIEGVTLSQPAQRRYLGRP